MHRQSTIKALSVVLTIVLCTFADPVQATEKYEFAETRELVEFVRAAGELVSKKGKAAFAQMSHKGSKWYSGDKYVFVTTVDGIALFNPPFPGSLGKSLWQVKDSWGKPIARLNVDNLTLTENGQKEGWVHYQWPRPGSIKPEWKTTYVVQVTGPDGGQYIVGSGLYNMKTEKVFVEDLVNSAVELLKAQGKDAFKLLNDKSSKYQFRDVYVFVMTGKGLELCNPGTPQIVGKSAWGYKSIDGKNVVQEMVKLVEAKGSGWISYVWTKPGSSNYYRKHTFVRGVKLDGELLLVAAGYYKQD